MFDAEGSYSIGCVALDPRNPNVVWVGTGENNSQRSVGYGDGVYKSEDGGKSWKNVGLKASEHIGKILVDPKNPGVVYVAAQGPLWAPGGDRGLYKTTDGGKTWTAVLTISENTGVSDVVMDPRDPDTLIAAAYQRRRHVYTLIDGGPESGLHKTTDGGATWKKLSTGLPKEDMGRIGLAIAPTAPDTVYAVVETSAANKAGGIFRSTDRGETWEKRSDYNPERADVLPGDLRRPEERRARLLDGHVPQGHGRRGQDVPQPRRALQARRQPRDVDRPRRHRPLPRRLRRRALPELRPRRRPGSSWRTCRSRSSTGWTWTTRRPSTTSTAARQDNNTLGGPSRTLNAHGIANHDWFVTWGGDGFHSRVDPTDPNIVYSTLQYGVLGRYDRRSGEAVLIQPQEKPGDDPLALELGQPAPHQPPRRRSGSTSRRSASSAATTAATAGRRSAADLTRQIDRNRLKVMGRVWGPDAVAKSASTSFYGNIVSLDESPLVEGLLYVGTDDGLVQVSEDGGKSWRKQESFPGVPQTTYVSDLFASRFDPDVVYAAFNHHKTGDFKPYLLRSADRGRTWTAVASDLPARGSVWTIAEDTVERDLLFAGTEFGLFVSRDAGKKWIQLKGGLPTIAVRDLAIQKRESDLVIATFGRGFYVLDDFTPLRVAKPADLEQEAMTFPVKKALAYIPSVPFGLKDKAFLGETFYTAPNPAFGAVFTYYLKDEVLTRRKARQKAEKDAAKKGEETPYPAAEELRAEAREEEPAVILDGEGRGRQRGASAERPGHGRGSTGWPGTCGCLPRPRRRSSRPRPTTRSSSGRRARWPCPGPTRSRSRSAWTASSPRSAQPQTFDVVSLGLATLKTADTAELLAFEKKTARLQRAVLGAVETAEEAQGHLALVKKALDDTPGADPKLGAEARRIDKGLEDLLVALHGDKVMRSRNEPVPMSTVERVEAIVSSQWSATVGADRHQPPGLRDRGRRVRGRAGDAADPRRHRPARAGGLHGEGGRALDAGPGAGLDEGVAAGDGRHRRSSTAGRGALGGTGVMAGSGAEAGVAASSAR